MLRDHLKFSWYQEKREVLAYENTLIILIETQEIKMPGNVLLYFQMLGAGGGKNLL
jgi:hypothetical protein